MNAQVSTNPMAIAIGAALAGGFFAGLINIGGEQFGIVVAPKEDGERTNVKWSDSYDDVEGARSLNDGFANTEAMLAAESDLAKWARGLRIGGFDDWYLPSQDEIEVIYRNLKPTDEENSCFARSGMNLHAVPPSLPYSHQPATKTEVEGFKAGGTEAFETDDYYWSSTQHAGDSGYAWGQGFGNGYQSNWLKDIKLRARAVRRIKI
jgi:hypothetical protein